MHINIQLGVGTLRQVIIRVQDETKTEIIEGKGWTFELAKEDLIKKNPNFKDEYELFNLLKY